MYLPKPPYTPGDLNGDDKINLVDVVLLIRYQAGWENLEIVKEAADFDGDGSVGTVSYTHLDVYKRQRLENSARTYRVLFQ